MNCAPSFSVLNVAANRSDQSVRARNIFAADNPAATIFPPVGAELASARFSLSLASVCQISNLRSEISRRPAAACLCSGLSCSASLRESQRLCVILFLAVPPAASCNTQLQLVPFLRSVDYRGLMSNLTPFKINTSRNFCTFCISLISGHLKSPIINTSANFDFKPPRINTSKKHGGGGPTCNSSCNWRRRAGRGYAVVLCSGGLQASSLFSPNQDGSLKASATKCFSPGAFRRYGVPGFISRNSSIASNSVARVAYRRGSTCQSMEFGAVGAIVSGTRMPHSVGCVGFTSPTWKRC